MKALTYVVFGATGDLMHLKLWPALVALYEGRRLPKQTHFIAVGRRPWSREEYLQDMIAQWQSNYPYEMMQTRIDYVQLSFDEPSDYDRLKAAIEKTQADEVVYYLATPPHLFPLIAQGIYTSKVTEKGNPKHRIVFEKPFGEDLKSAQEINQTLWNYFSENQIYRIDHYLGKEMIQNIFAVRFGNKFVESLWNQESILDISIIAEESVGVKARGPFYDKIGALKDMIQSHLLQMAALIAMDPPYSASPDDVKDQKVNVLKRFSIDPKSIVSGQYEGYLNETGVAKDSKTETAVFFKACLATTRFYDVPIYFLTGKKCSQKRSEIIIRFKPHTLAHRFFKEGEMANNELIIRIAPEEGVSVRFNAKRPGLDAAYGTVSMDYAHPAPASGNIVEAYQKLLLDVAHGHSTLFARWDEVETSWEITDTIKRYLNGPKIYKDGEDFQRIIEKHRQEVGDDLRCFYGDYPDDDRL